MVFGLVVTGFWWALQRGGYESGFWVTPSAENIAYTAIPSVPEASPTAEEVGTLGLSHPADMTSAQGNRVATPPQTRRLFTWGPRPADADDLEKKIPYPDRGIQYVTLDNDLYFSKRSPFWDGQGGGRVSIELPDHSVLEVTLTGTTYLGPKRFVSTGTILDQAGGRFLLAFNQGAVAAQVITRDHGEFQLRTVSSSDGQVAQFWRVEADRLPPCGGHPKPSLTADILAETMRGVSAVSSTLGSDSGVADVGSAVPIRLLFLYTRAVREAYGTASQVRAVIDLTLAGVNADLANSQTDVRIELAGTQEVDLNESGLNYSTTLTSLRGRADGVLDSVHAMRDAAHADLVTLAVNANDSERSLGIAYILADANSYLNPFFGFSVVQFSVMSSSHVLSHELGHNLGCAHDRENSSDGGGTYSYSYGYRFFATDSQGFSRQFRDIMAYTPGMRVAYFSNPRLQLSQLSSGSTTYSLSRPTAIGIEAGLPGEADNVRTINQNAFEVYHYRGAPDEQTGGGTLVNVSTRAFVGAGSQQLIGGLIVSGSEAKTVILRAAGPALLPYGVADALRDPLLRVFRLGETSPFAINGDWYNQANPEETVVPAFPFAVGSRDAALRLTLAPGGYTVNVEGEQGTQGTALVEAYETNASGTVKLINLSTRAYADSQRPMIAGFVVQPDGRDAARKKKLLIRVQGPSLAQYGVNDFLSDPVMRLYDSSGRFLLEIDDWDPPSTNLSDSTRLVRGQVDQYSEQQVFDITRGLGLESLRPVEPAWVVDVPPGGYSVVVQPFDDPASGQPAQPGVGLVEVYEVTVP